MDVLPKRKNGWGYLLKNHYNVVKQRKTGTENIKISAPVYNPASSLSPITCKIDFKQKSTFVFIPILRGSHGIT